MDKQEKQEILEIVASALEHEADAQNLYEDWIAPALGERLAGCLRRIAADVRGRVLPT